MSYSFAGRFYNKYKPFFTYDCKDYSFKVDMEYGELYFTRKLISFSGKHLPLNLSLKYVQRHVDLANDYLHVDTGFPRGFKTNYHVFLEYNSSFNKYLYEDMDGFSHEFKLAENSSSLYYDTFGGGLMLSLENNGFKIFDDDGNYQLFDQYGRLIKICKKVTSTYSAEQTIAYTNDLKISTITDNYGRTICFSYTGSYVHISYGNNSVITLYISNLCLTKITKNIGGHLIEDTFNQYYLVNSMLLSGGETIDFSYNGNPKVTWMETNIEQDVFSFDYDDCPHTKTWATVTNARGVSTRYDFDEEQTSSQSSNNSVNLAYLKINSDIASCLIKEGTNNNEITTFLFNNSESIDVNSYNAGGSQNITNNSLQSKKMYLFVAEIEGNLGTEHFDLALIDYDNNLLAKLIFKDNNRILAAPVGIRESTPKTFYVSYSNLAFNTITIAKARLVPLIGDFEVLCSNVNAYGPIFFYGDTPHYLFPNAFLEKINGSYVSNQQIKTKSFDFLFNEKLFYKANGAFHFWADDKRKLFTNVTSAYLFNDANACIGYDLSHGKIALYDSSYNLVSDLYFYQIKGSDNNTFSIIKCSHDNTSFHTGYTSYYYEKEETRYVAGSLSSITYHDYNQDYSLIEINRNDGYKEKYEYDSHANLFNVAISHTNIGKKINHDYGYDSNDNLTFEEKLVDSSFVGTEYEYDIFGNVSEISYPNSAKQAFLYDAITGERDLEVSFGYTDIFVFNQYNNYIDENNYSLQTDYNCYRFILADGNISEVKYNNQQILTITYQTNSYGGHTVHNNETINYSNGGSIYTEYDEFDRVYITNNMLHGYDEYNNLVSIIDQYYSSTYSTLAFTYDYYSQISAIQHYYNNLSLSFIYDIYRRLTNQTYLSYGSPLYTIAYSYYNNPDLENVIKTSSIAYGTTSINVTNDMDAFSRLTSQAVIIGNNNGVTSALSYCEAGPNSPYTNRMVRSVSYIYINNGYPSSDNISDNFVYDSIGNITSIQRKVGNNVSSQVQYVYDYHSRLIRENNSLLGKTYLYTYDNEGNIKTKKEYPYSTAQSPTNLIHTYSYFYQNTYSNKLTSFDGASITYDTVGNPITYRGKTMSWEKGTLLSQVVDGNNYIYFYYDGLKQRVRKEVNSSVTSYRYINNQLIVEERGSQSITYLYSHNGVVGFVLSGYGSSLGLNGVYFYEKNIQQDVVTIRNSSNQIMAIYQYDAWGNHVVLNPSGQINTSSTFIGNINPIRYRSYYYDTDLKMYWLTTRYYDPETGRFISPDHYSYLNYKKLHGINLYAYCRNNPVMYCDPSGHFFFTLLTAITTTVIATSVAVAAVAATVLVASAAVGAIIGDDDEKILDKPHETHTLSDGTEVNYYIKHENSNTADNSLKVYNSYNLSASQINEFLEWLISEGYTAIDIDRIRNEWIWHNLGYVFNFRRDATRTVDVFFDSDDVDHGIFSWIINNLRWW